jgi:hypothetical protein
MVPRAGAPGGGKVTGAAHTAAEPFPGSDCPTGMNATEETQVNLTAEDIDICSKKLVSAMNELQTEHGYSVDEVLVAVAYTLGFGFAETGAVLPLDLPLREAMPPLVLGYAEACRQLRES